MYNKLTPKICNYLINIISFIESEADKDEYDDIDIEKEEK
jgi:hypothetical protein